MVLEVSGSVSNFISNFCSQLRGYLPSLCLEWFTTVDHAFLASRPHQMVLSVFIPPLLWLKRFEHIIPFLLLLLMHLLAIRHLLGLCVHASVHDHILDLGAAQSSIFGSEFFRLALPARAKNYGSTAIMHPKLMHAPTGPINISNDTT